MKNFFLFLIGGLMLTAMGVNAQICISIADDLEIPSTNCVDIHGATTAISLSSGTWFIYGDGVAPSNNTRVVNVTGGTVNIILCKVNISPNGNACAFNIGGTANVTLTLYDENTLKSGGNNAGLSIATGATLTINGPGSLTATGGSSGAGIGGNRQTSHGSIIINSGIITAYGGSSSASGGAGIGGGGGSNSSGSNAGSITINGGSITAHGGDGGGGGAGIGGGGAGGNNNGGGTGGTITINDGDVTANGGEGNGTSGSGGGGGAGIGGGGCTGNNTSGGGSGTITIDFNLATVTSTGGVANGDKYNGANIGSGGNSSTSGTPYYVISIKTDPAPTTTVTEGSISGSLSIVAEVTNSGTLTYQWYENDKNSNSGGTEIFGETSDSFTIPSSLTNSGSPYHYYCVVSAPGNTMASTVATVNVVAVPVITIDTQPSPTTNVTEGSISGNLTVTASVTPTATLTYQWYSNTANNNTGGTTISGATSASFTIPTTLTTGTYYYFCEVSSTGAVSERSNVATVNVAEPTYEIELDPDTDKDFGTATLGYGAQTPYSVTISNEGNQPTGALTIALSGDNDTDFTLSEISIGSIAVEGYDVFTVVPKSGLAVGTYTATVTVSGSNGISESFDISFEVIPAPDYSIALDPAFDKDFGTAISGYSAPTAHSVKVSNTGNQPTGTLAVVLSGTNAASFALSTGSISSIGVSGNDNFTVVPNTGLVVGTYTATVTVSGSNSISETFIVTFEVTPVPTYGIELDPDTDKDFGTAISGYSAPTAHSVTVSNTGNQATGALTVALSGTNAASFALSTTSIVSLAVGGDDDFTVVPNTGLAVGIYDATVTVSGGNGISESFDVSFEVIAKTVTNMEVTTQPTKLDYVAGQTLNLDGLVVTLTYNDASMETVAFADFATEGLTTSPTNGTSLTVATHNGSPVTVTHTASSQVATTNNLTVTQPQEPTPDAKIKFEDATLYNLVPAGNYVIYGDGVNADASGSYPIDEDWFGKTVAIVKMGNGTTIESSPQNLPIPKRPDTPTPDKTDCTTIADDDGTITGVSTTMEYKLSTVSTWKDGTGSTITDLEPGIYWVRVKATATAFAGEIVTVTIVSYTAVPEATPAASIDFEAETLTGLESGGMYTFNGGAAVTLSGTTRAIEAGWLGTPVSIVKKGDGTNTTDSEAQTLPIPARPGAPTGLVKTNCTTTANNDGTITGANTAMEYKLSTALTWTDVAASPITGLVPGDYDVRLKATASAFAGLNATVTVGSYTVTEPEVPVISTEFLPVAFEGIPYSATLEATSATPITWSISGGFQTWMTFSTTGKITGTPPSFGMVTVTVTAQNASGSSVPKSLSLMICRLSISKDDAAAAPMNQPLSVTFGGAVTAQSLGQITVAPAVSGVVSVLIGNTLTIRHSDFAPNTTYTVTIPASAIGGLSDDIVWTFTTKALEVIEESKQPTPGSAINEASLVSVKFDGAAEIIDATKITVVPELSTMNPVIVNGNTLNIIHSAFEDGVAYTVKIEAGAIYGLAADVEWSFNVNNTATSITARTPDVEDIDVELDAKVEVTFNVSIEGSSFKGITIESDAGEMDLNFSLDETGMILRITHDDFAYDTKYTVTIPKEAINGLLSDQKWTFTTCPEPPLELIMLTPLNNETDVEWTVQVVVTFNKGITTGDISDKNYFAPYVAVKEVGITSNKLIITTYDDFEPDQTYTVTIPAGTVKGYDEVITWSFTTKAGSVTGYEVVDRLEAKLYPNPVYAGAEFTVQVDPSVDNRLIVELFTSSGVLLQKIETADAQFRMTAPNAVGVFLLRITDGNTAKAYRLVVH